MKKLLSILSLSALIFVSCSKSGDTIGSVNNNTGANIMVVTVDGTTYTWKVFATDTILTGQRVIMVTGIDTTVLITGGIRGGSFQLINISSPGTYDVGPIIPGNGLIQMFYTLNDSTHYASPVPAANSVGKVIITELTKTSIRASFNGTLTRNVGSSGATTVSLTNGSVNAIFR